FFSGSESWPRRVRRKRSSISSTRPLRRPKNRRRLLQLSINRASIRSAPGRRALLIVSRPTRPCGVSSSSRRASKSTKRFNAAQRFNPQRQEGTIVDTVLFLRNKDLPGLATTQECIEAIEAAYVEHGRGEAQELPRRRIYHPRKDKIDHYYWFNEMAGIVPGIRSMGLRVNSATVSVVRKRGNARLGFPGAFSALVFLFDTE